MASMPLIHERRTAIGELIHFVKDVVLRGGVTRSSLGEVERALESLARKEALFAAQDYPASNDASGMALYELHREQGDGVTLYLNVLQPGKSTRPHDHTTWAAIAAVQGEETNQVYARVDDESVPGRASLKLVRTVNVQPGTPICFMPEDIHSIHGRGDDLIRHLHLYGRPLDRLDGRMGYDTEAGTVVPYNKNFMVPAIVCQGTVAPSTRS